MTQRVPLGITIGAANSVAVVAGSDGVDGITVTRPTVLRLGAGAGPVLGTRAGAAGDRHGGIVLDGFAARIGDPVPIRAEDGSAHMPAALTAAAIGCLAEEARSLVGADEGASTPLVIGHPPGWTPHTVDVLVRALRGAGHDIVAVPEPVAAVRWATAAHRLPADTTVLVLDLGATGLTLSVVRDAAISAPALHTSDIAGTELDLLLMRYVLANTPRGNEMDLFDPTLDGELAALRTRCGKAKEELSAHTATVVAVHLDPGGCRVRVVRDEFEELLRPLLRASLGLIRDAVHRAGLALGELDRVLLTGGGAAIPLVAELISAEFALPVICAPDPGTTSARGAAVLAAERAGSRDMADAETAELTAIAAASTAPQPISSGGTALPTLRARDERMRGHRRRLAIVAAATVALGALATGTLAVGTGSHPSSEPDERTPSVVADPTGTNDNPANTSNSAETVADSGSDRDGAADRQPGQSSPGSTTGASAAAGGNSPPGPGGTAPGSAAPGSPPASGSPAPASPAPQLPAPPAITAPQAPPDPGLPTGELSETLDDTVDTLGDTVGPVLEVPGRVLEGSGG